MSGTKKLQALPNYALFFRSFKVVIFTVYRSAELYGDGFENFSNIPGVGLANSVVLLVLAGFSSLLLKFSYWSLTY